MLSNPRDKIIQVMSKMEQQGVHCIQCDHCQCCTYTSNSMMITRIEAYEIVLSLMNDVLWDEKLFERLGATIEQFQLKNFQVAGSRKLIRKYYTCPFLLAGPRGCALSRKVKPYGCLAFNAVDSDSYKKLNCQSDLTLLTELDSNFGQQLKSQNTFLEAKLSWYMDKMPIPNALLSFHLFTTGELLSWNDQLLADS